MSIAWNKKIENYIPSTTKKQVGTASLLATNWTSDQHYKRKGQFKFTSWRIQQEDIITILNIYTTHTNTQFHKIILSDVRSQNQHNTLMGGVTSMPYTYQ